MNKLRSMGVVCLTSALLVSAAWAQETETKVIDEVVAQVNDSVITLSSVRREIKDMVDAKEKDGMKRDEAQKLINDKQGEMIANLINEELLVQKAKDLGMDSDIEAAVNQKFAELMKQYNLKTVDALYQLMGTQGVDPQEVRAVMRKQITRERVIQREVQSKLFWSYTSKQLKDYFEKHKEKFTKPESVTLSEIFLKFAGRSEDAVRTKGKELAAKIKGGYDFVKAVAEFSDAEDKATAKGSLGSISIPELNEKFPIFSKAIKSVKPGEIAEPFEDELGVHLVRVDERVAASSETVFDENAVRMALMSEGFMDAQKAYLATLRKDSYIKINDSYRPLIAPILFADERKPKTDK